MVIVRKWNQNMQLLLKLLTQKVRWVVSGNRSFSVNSGFKLKWSCLISGSSYIWGTTIEIKLQSFFVLSVPSHVTTITTIFNFNEFIFVYLKNIRFICNGEIYLLHWFDLSIRSVFRSLLDWRGVIRYHILWVLKERLIVIQ